jgi:hypothetical protein
MPREEGNLTRRLRETTFDAKTNIIRALACPVGKVNLTVPLGQDKQGFCVTVLPIESLGMRAFFNLIKAIFSGLQTG